MCWGLFCRDCWERYVCSFHWAWALEDEAVHILVTACLQLSVYIWEWSRYDTDQGSWPSPINRNWLGARPDIQARLWDPCCSSGEQEQATGSLLDPSWVGPSLFLVWGDIRVCPRVRLEWSVGGLPTPSGIQGTCAVHCFCSWLFRIGCWVGFFFFFLYLLSRICPSCMHAVIFSPL